MIIQKTYDTIKQKGAKALKVSFQFIECFPFSLEPNPLGPLKGSNQRARRSQKRMVSPPKIISPMGEHIRYLPKPVGPWAEPTLAPRRWSLIKKISLAYPEELSAYAITHKDIAYSSDGDS
jgi:hypothetical protein